MATLEEMNVDLEDISFEPITQISLVMRNGKQVYIGTPLSIMGFTKLWNSHKKIIKVVTGRESYAYINKKCVDFYHACPIYD